jgi:hypothetical protein
LFFPNKRHCGDCDDDAVGNQFDVRLRRKIPSKILVLDNHCKDGEDENMPVHLLHLSERVEGLAKPQCFGVMALIGQCLMR